MRLALSFRCNWLGFIGPWLGVLGILVPAGTYAGGIYVGTEVSRQVIQVKDRSNGGSAILRSRLTPSLILGATATTRKGGWSFGFEFKGGYQTWSAASSASIKTSNPLTSQGSFSIEKELFLKGRLGLNYRYQDQFSTYASASNQLEVKGYKAHSVSSHLTKDILKSPGTVWSLKAEGGFALPAKGPHEKSELSPFGCTRLIWDTHEKRKGYVRLGVQYEIHWEKSDLTQGTRDVIRFSLEWHW